MSRWLQSLLWIGGTCFLWCPICVHLYGGGTFWICACTTGLITVTLGSSYAVWTGFNRLLTKGCGSFSCISSILKLSCLAYCKENAPADVQDKISLVTGSLLEQEIFLTAQTFQTQFVSPWYSCVSPDEKYSLQVKCILEDLLLNVTKTLHENVNPSLLIKSVIHIYIQHFRQFIKTIKKISENVNCQPMDCMNHYEEIRSTYKPLHSSLRADKEVDTYCCKLAHILLQNYLPSEIVRCDLLFVCLRDLIAQNVLCSLLDQLCDTQWLNGTLSSYVNGSLSANLSASTDAADDGCEEGTEEKEDKENVGIKSYSYLHSLSCIREETSMDLQDGDFFFSESLELTQREPLKGIPESNAEIVREDSALQGNNINRKEQSPPVSLNLSAKKIENTEGLLNYVKLSNMESKDTLHSDVGRSVSSALGTLISTTAAPLLSDRGDLSVLPLVIPFKMWESPIEEKKYLVDVKPIKKVNPFKRNIVEGVKEEDFQMLFSNDKKRFISKDDSLLEVSRKDRTNSWKSKLLNLKLNKDGRSLPRVIIRSNSLDDVSGEKEAAEEIPDLSARLSFSSEGIESLLHWAAGEEKKGRGHLVKMSSFDKNDGIDYFSPQSNSPTDESTLRSNPFNGKHSLSPVDLNKFINNKGHDICLENKEHSRCVNSSASTPSSSSTLALDAQDALTPSDESKALFNLENPDLSPIYEESENLASTIAKLRCLLSERESQHSLGSQSSFGSSESEPKSAHSDPGRYNLEKSRFTFLHKDSSSSLASVKSTSSSDSFGQGTIDEEVLEAAEVPLDGRVFISISIPSTDAHAEHGGFQYTVYNIQYDAIYLCEPIQTSSETYTAAEINIQTAEPKMVLQTNFVRRRFRDFLTLHSKFEDDSFLRVAMKGVKGPNKWLNLPFSKLDSATISSRRQFLEKYLLAIIQRPELNISSPLKEFLSYGSEASVAFAKKPLEINVPRIDKLLARTVSGVFHSIKTALPNFDSVEVSLSSNLTAVNAIAMAKSGIGVAVADAGPKASGPAGGEKATKASGAQLNLRRDFDVKLDITAEEEVCDMEEVLVAIVSTTSFESSPIEAVDESEELKCHNFNPSETDPSTASAPPEGVRLAYSNFQSFGSFWREISLAISSNLEEREVLGTDDETKFELFEAVLDGFVEVVSSAGGRHPISSQATTTAVRQLFAKPISFYAEDKVNSFFCDEIVSQLFQELRQLIVNPRLYSNGDASPEECSQSKEKLKASIMDAMPGALTFLFGQELTEESVCVLLETIQHPIIMKDFGLHVLDLIFVQMLLPI